MVSLHLRSCAFHIHAAAHFTFTQLCIFAIGIHRFHAFSTTFTLFYVFLAFYFYIFFSFSFSPYSSICSWPPTVLPLLVRMTLQLITKPAITCNSSNSLFFIQPETMARIKQTIRRGPPQGEASRKTVPGEKAQKVAKPIGTVPPPPPKSKRHWRPGSK